MKKFLDVTVDETQAAALRGVSIDTQRRHRKRQIGPRPFKPAGSKGYRYRLADLEAERDAAAANEGEHDRAA